LSCRVGSFACLRLLLLFVSVFVFLACAFVFTIIKFPQKRNEK